MKFSAKQTHAAIMGKAAVLGLGLLLLAGCSNSRVLVSPNYGSQTDPFSHKAVEAKKDSAERFYTLGTESGKAEIECIVRQAVESNGNLEWKTLDTEDIETENSEVNVYLNARNGHVYLAMSTHDEDETEMIPIQNGADSYQIVSYFDAVEGLGKQGLLCAWLPSSQPSNLILTGNDEKDFLVENMVAVFCKVK